MFRTIFMYIEELADAFPFAQNITNLVTVCRNSTKVNKSLQITRCRVVVKLYEQRQKISSACARMLLYENYMSRVKPRVSCVWNLIRRSSSEEILAITCWVRIRGSIVFATALAVLMAEWAVENVICLWRMKRAPQKGLQVLFYGAYFILQSILTMELQKLEAFISGFRVTNEDVF